MASFTRADFWLETGDLLNPSLGDEKRHLCARVGRWRVGHARPSPKFRCCSTLGHYMLHCHGRASDFYIAGGVLHCTPTWGQQLVDLGCRVPSACSNRSS